MELGFGGEDGKTKAISPRFGDALRASLNGLVGGLLAGLVMADDASAVVDD